MNNILILEDDIQFSRRIAQYGKQAIESLQGMEWDIVYFGHPFEEEANVPGWQVVDRPIHLSHFYAVNGQCIERLRDFCSRSCNGRRVTPTAGLCITTQPSTR